MLVTGKRGRTGHREILCPTPEGVSEFTAKLIENVVEVSKFFNIEKFFISGSIVKVVDFWNIGSCHFLNRSEVATFWQDREISHQSIQNNIFYKSIYLWQNKDQL